MGVNKCVGCEHMEDAHPTTKICVCELGKIGVHIKDGCESFNPHIGAACNSDCEYMTHYDGGYHCSFYNKKFTDLQQYCKAHAVGGYNW